MNHNVNNACVRGKPLHLPDSQLLRLSQFRFAEVLRSKRNLRYMQFHKITILIYHVQIQQENKETLTKQNQKRKQKTKNKNKSKIKITKKNYKKENEKTPLN